MPITHLPISGVGCLVEVQEFAFVEGDGHVDAMNHEGLVLEQEFNGEFELGGEEQDLEVREWVAVFDKVLLAIVDREFALEAREEKVLCVFGRAAICVVEHDRVEFEPLVDGVLKRG